MKSPLLALFTRALREDVRLKSTYWVRSGLICFVLFALVITHLTQSWVGAPGLQFFQSVIFINLLFISLSGLSYFASAITEEKEDMTLGLLRMTNLNPLSILLGKSVSRQVGALLLLVAQLPFSLLAVSLGGVTVAQILAAYAALAAFIVFLANLALIFSVMFLRTPPAAIATGAMTCLIFAGPVFYATAGLWLLHTARMIPSDKPGPALSTFVEFWNQLSPVTRLVEIGRTGFSDDPFCVQVWSNLAAGGLFFLFAWTIFNRYCSDQKDAAPARGLMPKGRRWLRFLGPGRAGRFALVWKDFHFMAGGKPSVAIKFLLYLGITVFIAVLLRKVEGSSLETAHIGFALIWVMALMLFLETAVMTSRVFQQERKWKTLSSLSLIPISTRRMAYHKVLGCVLASWPAVFFLGLGGVLVFEVAYKEFVDHPVDFSRGVGEAGFWFAGCVGSQTLFFYHLVAALSLRVKWGALPLAAGISFVGMWFFGITAAFVFGGRYAPLVVLCLLMFTLAIVLHIHTLRRLEKLAAED